MADRIVGKSIFDKIQGAGFPKSRIKFTVRLPERDRSVRRKNVDLGYNIVKVIVPSKAVPLQSGILGHLSLKDCNHADARQRSWHSLFRDARPIERDH
jgi:hypothetical protein